MTDRPIDYRLVYSKRRTLGLTIDGEGVVIARAPAGMPLWRIESFIAEKTPWILKHQALITQRASLIGDCALNEGAELPYLGGTLKIAFCDEVHPKARDGVLLLPRRGDPLTHALNWFAENARERLLPRVALWADEMRVYPASVAFGHARKRWGSMSAAGAMRLNIALLHCPPANVDYVIVHELAHRLHPDHSSAFHHCVASFLPGAPQLRAQMKELAPYLSLLRSN